MRGVRFGASRGDVVRLFEGESVVGLGEGELLARFATRRDEAAFEALVTRLGPMVLGVCRRMLSDPHDVDDAFQATFLVLVKKAGSIRDRDLVAPWLHGVASKVARRARARLGASEGPRARSRTVAGEVVEDGVGIESGWLELRALIDEEIERLPEAHRRAVVLCDVEGLEALHAREAALAARLEPEHGPGPAGARQGPAPRATGPTGRCPIRSLDGPDGRASGSFTFFTIRHDPGFAGVFERSDGNGPGLRLGGHPL